MQEKIGVQQLAREMGVTRLRIYNYVAQAKLTPHTRIPHLSFMRSEVIPQAAALILADEVKRKSKGENGRRI